MTTVREVCQRALKLINEPGRGGILSADDLNDAFATFKEIVDSESVSMFFRPGIRTHFFAVNSQQFVYSYGPGGEFDTDNFNDAVPIQVESAYMRAGDTIANNELITNGKFDNGSNDWTVGAGWSVLNNRASFDQSIGDGVLAQALTWDVNTVYVIEFDVIINAGAINVQLDGGAFSQDITTSGSYRFEYTATTAPHSLTVASVNVSGDSAILDNFSIIAKGKAKVELQYVAGTDYPLRIMDQKTYNRAFSKGTGGRPDKLLFSRSWPLGEIKFDHLPTYGEILIMDVTTTPQISSLDQALPFHPDAVKYLRYQIAADIAPEYGKALTVDQMRTLRDAKSKLYAGNKRGNKLRMDNALLSSRRYNINQGDQ